MQRRSWLKCVGAAVGGACLSPIAAGEEKKRPWKTAVGLNGFESGVRKYHKNYPIWEILDFASRTGFDGIELVSNWPMGGYPGVEEKERIRALRRMYDGFGLQIFSIQLGADGAFSPDAEERKRWLQETRDHAQFCQEAGGERIGLWPGGELRGQTIDEAIGRLGELFREVGKIVADLGMIASFEIEPPFVFNTEDHIQRILAKANHPSLKTMFDPSHYDLMSGSTGKPHEMLKRIGVENIGYVHLTDADGTLRDGGTSKHLACGDGHVDIDAALKTLYDGGYQGWIMIDAWEIPDPYDACVKGKKAIERALRNG